MREECKGCPVGGHSDHCWILDNIPKLIKCPCWKCILMTICSTPCKDWEKIMDKRGH